MRPLRTFALRTQFAAVVAFLVVFSLGAAVSSWRRSTAETELATAFHSDLALATKLPRLKALLRSLDLVTAQYLKTGRPQWIEEHGEILAKVRAARQELAELATDEREKRILDELERQLSEHFRQEEVWIQEKRAGRLSTEAIARLLASRRQYEEVLDLAMTMHDVDLQDLRARLDEARRSSRSTLWIVLGIGLAASALLSWGLSRLVIEPIRLLSTYARTWRPGEPWTCEAPTVSPEINGLFLQMKELMESLNAEYRREKDMGRLKSQLVSTVSHELNNSLSVINAASVNLEESDPGAADPDRERMYRMIKRQTLGLSRVVGNLLNLGRLESGKLSLAKKETDMRSLLQASLEVMELLAENKRLKLSLRLPEAPLAVFADPDALVLVLTNLLSNAIKYTPEGGSVTLGCERDPGDPGFARVFVEDSGIGVAPEERERIFSGAYRSERGRRMGKGFGIGLSLAKSIVEAHGGTLDLESEPGRGSRFHFQLPLWRHEARAEREEARA